MADPSLRHSWSWGYDIKKSTDLHEDVMPPEPGLAKSPLMRRMSISVNSKSDLPKHKSSVASKILKMKERVMTARDECLELRQEASDLQEYSNAKLGRVTRYLGVLAEKARKLDQIALDSEDRITPLLKEKKRLFNDLLTIKGNIRVYVRVRPQFEDEGPVATAFPDDYTIRITQNSALSPGKKEFEFDRVYGPHIGQENIFQDVQPLVQSAIDGYNVCIFSYGQTGSGKTHTMEGLPHDRGIYFRASEELFDLKPSSIAKLTFSVTMFELYNEQVKDLLRTLPGQSQSVPMGDSTNLVQVDFATPAEFSRVFRLGVQNRASERTNRSHLAVTIHLYHTNSVTGATQYSKLSMVDMAGSERIPDSERGNRITESLHINRSLSALGDVVSALTAKKENIPYGNSKLTQIFSDSLGGESKTLIIVNINPSNSSVQETLSSLSFAARVRNVEMTLGNRDSIKKWRDVANDARKELYEKERVVSELQEEMMRSNKNLKEADEQCVLLFNEVQKAWKVAFDLQADFGVQQSQLSKMKSDGEEYAEKYQLEKEKNSHLNVQMAQISKIQQDQKIELLDRGEKLQILQGKIKELQQQILVKSSSRDSGSVVTSRAELQKAKEESETVLAVKKKLEVELSKRDELIERLHQENEKLFERLTDKSVTEKSISVSSPKIGSKGGDESSEFNPTVSGQLETPGTLTLLNKTKSTPAGEYLTAALTDFNPVQYDGAAAISDGANKLLMLVLAAVIKAGAAREHEMLAEIRDAVFTFIRKIEPLKVMDTMLVSRVRILYIRSLLSRSSELQAIKMPCVERFLEKSGTTSMRRGSRSSSPSMSPHHHLITRESDYHLPTFKLQLKQERISKLSSIVLKIRGLDQETWKQHVSGAKLREISEDARSYAIGNRILAALFVHTPAGELQRQIRTWLAENFDFLSLTGGGDSGDNGGGGGAGDLELLSTAIMDGWMAGLGMPSPSTTDALGQLLSDYTKRVYTSQLQHLKDVAATLATEEADDLPQLLKLRSALETVEHKRRKVLQQMRSDVSLLTKEEGGSPLRNPPTATEDARVASLISLEDILRQTQDIFNEVSEKKISATRKRALISRLVDISGKLSSLLSIDNTCAQKHISEARKLVESTREDVGSRLSSVEEWSVLQFNNGTSTPLIIRCGATAEMDLVVKSEGEEEEEEEVKVAKPNELEGLSVDEIKKLISSLPKSLSQLAIASTADATRARYARLYNTLAVRVPALRHPQH